MAIELMSLVDFHTLADAISGFYGQIHGSLGDGTGSASTLAVRAQALTEQMRRVETSTVLGVGDPNNPPRDFLQRVTASWDSVGNNAKTSGYLTLLFASLISEIESHCSAKGSTVNSAINGLNAFLTYWRTTLGYADACVDWRFGKLYQWKKGGETGATLLSADNVWPPVTLLGSYNITTSTFTAGTAITRVNSGSTQGYRAPEAEGVVTATITGGAAAVTVTGTDRAGNAGRTWTASIPSGSVSGDRVALVAGTATDNRIASISNIVVATATGGAFGVYSTEERAISGSDLMVGYFAHYQHLDDTTTPASEITLTWAQTVQQAQIQNLGGATVYVEFDTVATANSYPLPAGSTMEIPLAHSAIHVYSAAGGEDIYVLGFYN
ncbi:MAG: hypothetical protein A2Z99_06075 [Treponema sp. GWB1_62_6]|nr:MAG: hypothetical protein A2Z99_06075 [Treponema sp. GWB1_62_6]